MLWDSIIHIPESHAPNRISEFMRFSDLIIIYFYIDLLMFFAAKIRH